MRGVVLIGTLLLLCASAAAAPQITKTLNVSVDVVVDAPSAQLEIIAQRTDFLVVYLSSQQSFQHLDIPFTVRSRDGVNHNYDLTLAQLGGQCTVSGGGMSLLTLSAHLDGQPFNALNSGHGTAAPEQAHVLTLTFPNISQVVASQSCDGVAAVVAAVTI